jgi:hypothetical protein
MQTLKVFIFVEGESGKDELRIDGNLETLRAFLLGVGNFEIQSFPARVDPLPLADPVPTATKTKRKPNTIPQPIPQTA